MAIKVKAKAKSKFVKKAAGRKKAAQNFKRGTKRNVARANRSRQH